MTTGIYSRAQMTTPKHAHYRYITTRYRDCEIDLQLACSHGVATCPVEFMSNGIMIHQRQPITNNGGNNKSSPPSWNSREIETKDCLCTGNHVACCCMWLTTWLGVAFVSSSNNKLNSYSEIEPTPRIQASDLFHSR